MVFFGGNARRVHHHRHHRHPPLLAAGCTLKKEAEVDATATACPSRFRPNGPRLASFLPRPSPFLPINQDSSITLLS